MTPMSVASEFSLGSVETALSPQERFEEFLQSRGKRVTRQRRVIVDHVASRHEHFDAEQLLADLRKTREGARASRPTVYRTVYEHDYGYPQHDHLYCTGCRKLIEFSSEEVARICDAVAAGHQFRAQSHRLIVTGICADCRTSRSKTRLQDRV
jgi:Fur family ferric uptake transcriptional regulator